LGDWESKFAKAKEMFLVWPNVSARKMSKMGSLQATNVLQIKVAQANKECKVLLLFHVLAFRRELTGQPGFYQG
jgi:hypothetical protein